MTGAVEQLVEGHAEIGDQGRPLEVVEDADDLARALGLGGDSSVHRTVVAVRRADESVRPGRRTTDVAEASTDWCPA